MVLEERQDSDDLGAPSPSKFNVTAMVVSNVRRSRVALRSVMARRLEIGMCESKCERQRRSRSAKLP